MSWINGNKAYLGAIAFGILGLLWSQDLVNDEIAGTIAAVLTTWTGIAFRHALAKSSPNNLTPKE